MSKRDKLIDRLLNRPSDFEYDEAKSLLEKFGYREDNRGRASGLELLLLTMKQTT